MELEPITVTDPKFWKWADQRLDATLGTIPTRSVITRGSGTSHIDQSFREGCGKKHGGNASGATKPTATHCRPYCTSGVQVILQWLGTGSTDGICSGLHRSWHTKNLWEISNVQGMCWQPTGIIGRDDVLGQDQCHPNWYSSILRQAGNWRNGKQNQPGRPGGNLWKHIEWYFTIAGDPKNDTRNWRRDQEVRGRIWITRDKNPSGGTPDEKIRSKAPTKKLVWIKRNSSHIFCIIVGIVWRGVPTIWSNL